MVETVFIKGLGLIGSSLARAIKQSHPQTQIIASDINEEALQYAKENNIKINFIKIDSLEKAKNVPCIFNNWANFYKGEFISNTILNANSFEKLISK